ncbi:MAG TPA: ABC transporter permease [Nitrospirae bacterium]|nr:lipoprotein-releasing system transmembrane protein LolE [bacterium BMS3Abin06]HDH12835.1 ABC transporter permease [Nitrospirota bacterium]HDZ01612.1 ABC transporter permease [Nitrospirota bacterium]
MYMALSWRNLWRNKKRTLIAVASVLLAVLVAVVMRSMQDGSYAYMIRSSVRFYTGYMQVQGNGYWENRSLDRSIVIDEKQQKEILQIPHITSIVPRLEAFSLVSFEKATRVAQIIGIDPAAQNNMTGLGKRLVQGKYLTNTSNGVLIAEGLADMLKAGVGDSIVLYGQGYHGNIAAARLPVAGIVRFPVQEMNNASVFLALGNAQNIFSAFGRITSLAIMLDDIRNQADVHNALSSMLGRQYTIMSWEEMMPDLVQGIELDNASGLIMLIILYIVIAFGVFSTIMMMTTERAREFGILISVGMRKTSLIWVTTLETVFLASIGAIVGVAVSLPVIIYFHFHPIPITGGVAAFYKLFGVENPVFYFSVDPGLFIHQAIVVLLIALATALYPLFFIKKLQPVQAMRC